MVASALRGLGVFLPGRLAVKADIRTLYFCMYCAYANVCAYKFQPAFLILQTFLISIYSAYTLVVFRAVFRLPLSLFSSMIQPESSSELSFRSPLDCDRLLRHSPQNARTCYSKAVPFLPPILDSNKSSLIISLRGGTNFLFPSFINWIYLCS